jgi:hypothetical protein
MRLVWLVALAVILALVVATSVVAGPSRPAGGDPDIWERSRPYTPSFSLRPATVRTEASAVVDLVVFKANLKQQDARDRSGIDRSRLPVVSERTYRRR